MKKPKPPLVRGDPLKSKAYLAYLAKLQLPTIKLPLTKIPEHQRPTLQEWALMQKLKKQADAKQYEKDSLRLRKQLDAPIVEDIPVDADLDLFSFEDAVTEEADTSLQVLRENSERLTAAGFDVSNIGHEQNHRARHYVKQLYAWTRVSAQSTQERLLTDIFPQALALRSGLEDASEILTLSLGEAGVDKNRMLQLLDRLSHNAVTARLFVHVCKHYKLSPEEKALYLQYHLYQTVGNTKQEDLNSLVKTIMATGGQTDNLPYPSPPKRKNEKPKK